MANNEAAFPMCNEYAHQNGMSLRDYFAGQTLAGLIIHADGWAPPEQIAKDAYSCADAMLIEREKEQS